MVNSCKQKKIMKISVHVQLCFTKVHILHINWNIQCNSLAPLAVHHILIIPLLLLWKRLLYQWRMHFSCISIIFLTKVTWLLFNIFIKLKLLCVISPYATISSQMARFLVFFINIIFNFPIAKNQSNSEEYLTLDEQ